MSEVGKAFNGWMYLNPPAFLTAADDGPYSAAQINSTERRTWTDGAIRSHEGTASNGGKATLATIVRSSKMQ